MTTIILIVLALIVGFFIGIIWLKLTIDEKYYWNKEFVKKFFPILYNSVQAEQREEIYNKYDLILRKTSRADELKKAEKFITEKTKEFEKEI